MVSPQKAMAVFRQFGFDSVRKVKENPYVLCMVRGLTFEDADRVAEKESIPKDSDERFFACSHVYFKVQ